MFLVFITHKGQRFSEVALAAFSIIKQYYSTLGKNILELFEKGIHTSLENISPHCVEYIPTSGKGRRILFYVRVSTGLYLTLFWESQDLR